MPDWISTLKALLEMGWPGLVTIAVFFLARQYMSTVESEIAYLRERIALLESELIRVKQQFIDEHLRNEG